MTKCPVCRARFPVADYAALALHLVERAGASNPEHVRWLNQSITRRKSTAQEITAPLERLFALPPEGLAAWMRARFIARFFGARPHPFVAALQHPTRATLLGYAVEHRHFLLQWVHCCAYILARTDQPAVMDYELDNLRTEYGGEGPDRPSHYELLLRMGIEAGLPQGQLLSIPPLPTTRRVLAEWDRICAEEPWVAAMGAMHALELIAHRDLLRHGATVHYFDPAILTDGSVPPAARAFLREGYEADVDHAEEALRLVEANARHPGAIEDVQGTFLRSVDLFDDYLLARLERAEGYGPTA